MGTRPLHSPARRRALRQLAAGGLAASALGAHGALAAAGPAPGRILIRGGLVVNADGRRQADVLIADGRIEQVGSGLSASGRGVRVIEAQGLQLLPGGIDPHVHLTPPFSDDFESGSRAALAGGITTVGAMVFPDDGESVDAMLARHERLVASKAIVDVVLHPFLGAPPELSALAASADAGYGTFKAFLMDGDFDRDYLKYAAALEKAKALGVLPLLHCEDGKILGESQRKLMERGQASLEHYEASRPALAEVLAVQKAVALCELTGSPIYIVHLSSARALEVCREARSRGLPVHVETRPLYLHLTSEKYRLPQGALYVGMPPARSAGDGEALWRGLADGSIETIGSDHAPWTRQQKLDPKHDISDPLAGMSNVEVMLPMLYSEGVLKDRLSLERFVAVTSTNAAKLFGLYPRKGVLQPGADADIALWDPSKAWTIRSEAEYTLEDFSIYEGWKVTGAPRMTLRRGVVACENHRVSAAAGSGMLLRRGRRERSGA